MSKNEIDVCVNGGITAATVRVIDDEGKQVGVLTTYEALKLADSRGFDLVEISPDANPPVCKLLNFDKYRYDLSRKNKDLKKKQVSVETKEIKFRPKTDINDLNVKINQIRKFVSQNKRVRLTLQFSGREVECSRNIGFETIGKVIHAISDVVAVIEDSRFAGKSITALVGPR